MQPPFFVVRALLFALLLVGLPTVPAAAHDPAETVVGDVVEAKSGRAHSCAVTKDARLHCWGYNSAGQLGEGTTTDRHRPVPVAIPFTKLIAHVEPGFEHTCAVTTDGNIYCWGSNAYGQLGDGTTTNRTLPQQIVAPLGDAFVQVAVGGFQTCGLTALGRLYCWGRNDVGAVGDGSGVDKWTPTLVAQGQGLVQGQVTDVTAGQLHSCAVLATGESYCWGSNFYGQLGNGTTGGSSLTPVRVLANWVAASVSSSNWSGSTCAVSVAGEAFCWGRNQYGQLGDGSTVDRNTPGAVFGGSGLAPGTVAEVSIGEFSACGVSRTARAYCWGHNGKGQIGDGTTLDRLTPTLVNDSTGFRAVAHVGAAGNGHVCGSTLNGQAYCWGYNFWGQLGDGSTADSLVPLKVDVATQAYEPVYDDVTACAGAGHGDCPATRSEPYTPPAPPSTV